MEAQFVRATVVLAWALLLSWCHAFVESACAATVPIAGIIDSRVRTAVYNSDEIYRLEGQIGYQIEIQFEPGETFVGLGAGDLQALAYVAAGNHLFLKPKATHIGTNVTVMTSLRDYRFEYSVAAHAAQIQDTNVIYVLKFLYPAPGKARDAQTVPTPGETLEKRLDAGRQAAPRNLDYGYCGNPSLRPLEASDDGMHTRLRFGARADLPAIFVRNDDGSESLLNFSMEDGDVIIHRVARQFILRRGKLTGCVVNGSYSGSGERAASETTSPDVMRATLGVTP